MNRSTTFYLSTLAVCGAGLWAILAAGARLTAPTDLSGRWHISSSPTPALASDMPPTAAATNIPTPEETDPPPDRFLIIRQSGRFLGLTLPERPLLNLQLREEHLAPAGETTLTFEDPTQRLDIKLHPSQPPIGTAAPLPSTSHAAKPTLAEAKHHSSPRRATFVFSGALNLTFESTLVPPAERKPGH